MLCFLPQIPPRNQLDSTSLETVEGLSEEQSSSFEPPNEIKVQYLEIDELEAFGVPLTDTTDRRDTIKSGEKPIRTAKIRITQEIHGNIAYQLETAGDTVSMILELTQLVQEVTHDISDQELSLSAAPQSRSRQHIMRY